MRCLIRMRFIQDLIWNKRGCFKSSSAGSAAHFLESVTNISRRDNGSCGPKTRTRRYLRLQTRQTCSFVAKTWDWFRILFPERCKIWAFWVCAFNGCRRLSKTTTATTIGNLVFRADTLTIPCALLPVTTRQHFAPGSKKTKIDEKYYSQILGQDISTTPKQCTTETMRKVIKQHLESPSALAIFALADVLAMDGKYINERDPNEETINDPTNSRHYWRFRFPYNFGRYEEERTVNGRPQEDGFESSRDVPR